MENRTDHNRLEALECETKTHIVQCEERWKTCFQRLENLDDGISRLESILIGFAGGALVATIGVIVAILWG